MIVYRLTKPIYADHLSGKGAAIRGGRWNSKGVEVIYTSSNRSLAMAEVAVHLSLELLPDEYKMMSIYIPDDAKVSMIAPDHLDANWVHHPPKSSTKALGDQFVTENSSLLLKVPSVVTRGEFNYLINPYHTRFSESKIIKVEPFLFDLRFLK